MKAEHEKLNKVADEIIIELDEYARRLDVYEYGLPTFDDHMDAMRRIVRAAIAAATGESQ